MKQSITAEANLQDVATLITTMRRNREPLVHCAEKQLEQIALALAGVAQDEDAGGGLVLGTAIQIHDDVGTM